MYCWYHCTEINGEMKIIHGLDLDSGWVYETCNTFLDDTLDRKAYEIFKMCLFLCLELWYIMALTVLKTFTNLMFVSPACMNRETCLIYPFVILVANRCLFMAFWTDEDSNGVIDQEELKKCFNKLDIAFTEEEIKDLFDACDINDDMGMKFNEFIVLLCLVYLFKDDPVALQTVSTTNSLCYFSFFTLPSFIYTIQLSQTSISLENILVWSVLLEYIWYDIFHVYISDYKYITLYFKVPSLEEHFHFQLIREKVMIFSFSLIHAYL